LDELADALFEEGRANNVVQFKTEIEALNAVSIVLTAIQKLFKQIGLEAFGYTLQRDLSLALQ
jgi:hypothetical protein